MARSNSLFISSVILLVVSTIVMLGWLIENRFLVQVIPGFAPMQFNTAFCFFFLGFSALFQSIKLPKLARVFSFVVLFFAGGTLLQYLLGWDFRIDTLFIRPFTSDRTENIGRMAPNTAISFLFYTTCFLYFLQGSFERFKYASCVCVIPMSMATIALLGYIVSLEDAYGWYYLTDMAIHTALLMLTLGVGLFFYILQFPQKERLPSWGIVPLTVYTFSCALLLWRALDVSLLRNYLGFGYYEYSPIVLVLVLLLLSIGIFCAKQIIDLTTKLEIARSAEQIGNQSKMRLIQYLSHEVRSPLGAIIGFSEPFKDLDLKESEKEAFQGIYNAGQHLKNIVDDLISYVSFDAGKLKIEKRVFDFKSLIEKVKAILNFRAETNAVHFEIQFDESLDWTVVGDEPKIGQIIINLCDNALKHTLNGGDVLLKISQEIEAQKQFLWIEVTDSGEGIPHEKMREIFDPFVQVKETPLEKGIGLGLSICKTFVGLMEGEIFVDSQIGIGSSFKVKIPV